MSEVKSEAVSSWTSGLTSWCFLIGGIVIWAATVLVPAHLDVLKLEKKHAVMQLQAEHMTAQRDRYKEFRLAVDRREPTAVALLADKHLNLRPADRVAFEMPVMHALAEADEPRQRAEISLIFHQTSHALATPERHSDFMPYDPDAFAGPMPDLSMASAGVESSASLDEWLYEPLPAVPFQPDVLPEADTRLARMVTGQTRMLVALAAGLLIFVGLMLR